MKDPHLVQAVRASGFDVVDISWVYPLLGLLGEAGELSNKMKKVIRDKGFKIDKKTREDIVSEDGDIDWYNAEFCHTLKIKRNDVVKYNLTKLNNRKKKNTIKGAGDNR